MKPLLALAACALALSLPSLGSSSTLYTSLPDNLDSSPNIFGEWSGSGEFNLENDSIVTSATISNWMSVGVEPSTLDWSIQSSAGGGVLFSGTGATLTNLGPTLVDHNGTAYPVYLSTFTLPDIALAGGIHYWLHLSNCGTDIVDGCGWGLSAAGGDDIQFDGQAALDIGKFAFSIQGDRAAPEPATWLMFVPAIAGLAAVIRRRA
jgi:hypothetical protein